MRTMSATMVRVQTPSFEQLPSRRVLVRRAWYAEHKAQLDAMATRGFCSVLMKAVA